MKKNQNKAREPSMNTKIRTVYQSSGALFYMLKFLGLAPYSFDYKTLTFKMGLSNYLTLFIPAACSAYFFFFSVNCFIHESYESGVQSKFVDQLWQWSYLLQHLFAFATILFNFFKRKHIENFLKLIHKFDKNLEHLGWKFKVKNSNLCNLFVLCVQLFFLCLIIVYCLVSINMIDIRGNVSNFVKVVRMLAYQLMNQFYFMVSIQFILSAYLICSRLKVLMKNVR